MIVKGNNKEERLRFFKALYERAQTKTATLREYLQDYLEQYKGTRLFGRENPGAKAADVVCNITYELIESQIDTNIPPARVDPERWSEKNGRNAKTVEHLCNNLRNKLPFEEMNDLEERYTYVFGGSVRTVLWDNSIRSHGEVGGISIDIINPQYFLPEPGIYNIDDMEYCFFEYTSTPEDAERRYDVVLTREDGEDHSERDEDDNIVIVVCFYKNEEGNVSQYIFSGDNELSDIDDFFARKRYVCSVCGRRRELCKSEDECDCGGSFVAESEEYEELTHDIELSDGRIIPAMSPVIKNGVREQEEWEEPDIDAETGLPLFDDVDGLKTQRMKKMSRDKMQPTRIRWYKPRSLPVIIRKNTSQLDTDDKKITPKSGVSINMQFLGQSDCEYIKYQQWEVNKIESRIHQKLLRSSLTPYLPEDATIKRSNGVFEEYIELKPNEHPSQYGVIDTTPNITLDMNQSERVNQRGKNTLGITNSFQGQSDSTAQSGKAKQVQVAQSAGRLVSKRVMKNSSIARMDRIIFEYHLAYADEPRPAAYKDEWGRIHNASFRRYDFLEYDEYTGEWYYDDRYLFSVDASSNVEADRPQIWEMNMQNFAKGLFGNPQDVASLVRYWQAQEEAHYPNARRQVEYFQQQYLQQRAAAMQKTPGGQIPQNNEGQGIING